MMNPQPPDQPTDPKDDATQGTASMQPQAQMDAFMTRLAPYLQDGKDATAATAKKRPPVHLWHPKRRGSIDIVIKANGEWWHDGRKMTRQSLVDLFASVLWRETNEHGEAEYFLKTPVEQLQIQVEDAPLYVNEVSVVKEAGVLWIQMHTSTGDVVRLDEAHMIELRDHFAQSTPYVQVHDGLEARIGRNAYYHLIEIGELSESDGVTTLTLMSGGSEYRVTSTG